LIINSDSELMVKQMNGAYRVKNEGLRPLYQQAVALCKHFDSVTIQHIYREENSQADALCNEAMDNPRTSAGPAFHPVVEKKKTAAKPDRTKTVEITVTPLMHALDVMKQSATEWAKSGNAHDPPPVEV